MDLQFTYIYDRIEKLNHGCPILTACIEWIETRAMIIRGTVNGY